MLPDAGYERPDDVLWEPCNNDMEPTEAQPGDYELPEWDDWDEDANRHEALMGGWCAHHPDRPADGRIVGSYTPSRPLPDAPEVSP